MLYTNTFVTRWNVSAGDTLYMTISLNLGDNSFYIDWGDGSQSKFFDSRDNSLFSVPKHQYSAGEEYNISIRGRCAYFEFGTANIPEETMEPIRKKLIQIISWGDTELAGVSFSAAINLKGEIPEPVRETFVKCNDFTYMFSDCVSITSIPDGFFNDINSSVTSFKSIFSGCKNLEYVPEDLFSKAINVTSFEKAFYSCKKLQIPKSIFDNCQKVTDFVNIYRNCESTNEIPNLWNRTTTGLNGKGCFMDVNHNYYLMYQMYGKCNFNEGNSTYLTVEFFIVSFKLKKMRK